MQDMSLFGKVNEKSDDNAMQIINELGLEFYGNPKIVKTLLEFYNRGMIYSNDESYLAYIDSVKKYGDTLYRDIISANVIDTIDKFLDRKPSNGALRDFIRLNPTTKKFILEYPSVEFDYNNLYELESCDFFESFSNAACLLLLTKYSFDELKSRKYSTVSDSIEILLHSIEEFSVKPDLDLLLKVGKNITEEQATIIELISYTGVTLEDLYNCYTQWDKFLVAASIVFEFIDHKDEHELEKTVFMLRYLYNVFSIEELKVSTNSLYLSYWFVNGLFKKVLSDPRCSEYNKKAIKDLALSDKCFNSFEFVINGSTRYLVPVDAALDEAFTDKISNLILCNTYVISYSLQSHKRYTKLVIYLNDNHFYNNGERSFSTAFDVDTLDCNIIYDSNEFMDIFFEKCSTNCNLFDCEVISYIRKNFSETSKKEELYSNLSLQDRYHVYLSILASINGHSDYSMILTRDDMGIQFIKVLGLFIRPDDSFCSAILRFHFAYLKIPFVKYNRVFSVKSNIISVGNEQVNLLAIFSGDKSGIISMQRFSPDDLIKLIEDRL